MNDDGITRLPLHRVAPRQRLRHRLSHHASAPFWRKVRLTPAYRGRLGLFDLRLCVCMREGEGKEEGGGAGGGREREKVERKRKRESERAHVNMHVVMHV